MNPPASGGRNGEARMTRDRDTSEFQTRLQRLETLIHEAERHPDPVARGRTREIVQAILDLHAAGLDRLLGHLTEAGEAADGVLDACARDEVVAGMLLLHGLHPLDLETRVQQALDEVRPSLRSHGGDVSLIGVVEGVVRLRLEGSCGGCPSSAAAMRQTAEEAVYAAAPDAAAVEVEGMGGHAEADGLLRFALPLV